MVNAIPVATEKRVGATRRDRIPADVLWKLNSGQIETATLAEWLAVDMEALLEAVISELRLTSWRGELQHLTRGVNELGVTKRLESIGHAIHSVTRDRAQGVSAVVRVAAHRSDVVRQWAVYAVAANPKMDLAARLAAVKPFAADANMSVRECAWMAFRPFVISRTTDVLKLLPALARDPDPNVRRFASEVSRPRSVWCAHAPLLKSHPNLARDTLDPLKSDSSRYVQLSVGNWLNDASKTRPDWVLAVCEEWSRSSDAPATHHIVRRGMRSIDRGSVRAQHTPLFPQSSGDDVFAAPPAQPPHQRANKIRK